MKSAPLKPLHSAADLALAADILGPKVPPLCLSLDVLRGVLWIAYNDEPANLTDEVALSEQLTVVMLCDMTGVGVDTLARMVMILRAADRMTEGQ